MQIKIAKILQEEEGGSLIEFETSFGGGIGIWIGSIPEIGMESEVEFEIDEEFVWGKDIELTNIGRMQMARQGSGVRLVGEIISYEEDDCLSVQLGESVILLEVEGAPRGISSQVEFKVQSLQLYPVNL